MRKCLTTAVLGLSLVGAASAQGYGYNNYGYGQNQGYQSNYNVDQCATQRREGQTGGAIVGGLIGALAGGAIGNNIDNDGDRYRRGYRGYRGYGGYRGHRGHRNQSKSNSGNVAAGAIVGGLLGAVAGSKVGKDNVNCRTYHDSVNTGYRGNSGIAPPTRQAWPEPQSYPVSQPSTVYRTPQPSTVYRTPQPTTRTYPAPAPVYRDDDLYGGREQCETLTRVTRLPDGREIREPVQDCEQGDVYYERDGRRVQGGY